MPKRIARLAKRHPVTTNLIICTLLFSVGFWRVEHLYNCANDYAEQDHHVNQRIDAAESRVAALELKVEKADNDVSEALGDITSGHGGSIDFDQITVAANRRDRLGDRLTAARNNLAQVIEENPTPKPSGTFC